MDIFAGLSDVGHVVFVRSKFSPIIAMVTFVEIMTFGCLQIIVVLFESASSFLSVMLNTLLRTRLVCKL